MKDVETVSELLRPCEARLMRCYAVGTRVNNVVNDDEAYSRASESVALQDRLF